MNGPNKNSEHSAYPLFVRSDYHEPGLTKRELFAAMAMQGLLSNLRELREMGFYDSEIESYSLMRADALLAALEDGKK